MEQQDAEELEIALREAIQTRDVEIIDRNLQGQKYRLDFPYAREEKQAIIRSVWIMRHTEDFPPLVTCYVL